MSKKLRWRITRIRGNRAELLGVVEAPDEKAAIKAAIKEFKVLEPHHQKRLTAVQGTW